MAVKHPSTPWYARLLAICVVAYALSPIDLIPDPIPVLGQLDDLLLVPLGIALARWLIPVDVLAECRGRAEAAIGNLAPRARWLAAAVVLVTWIMLLGVAARWVWSIWRPA
jgi:uncharacterized membrane protein YkvA (DUF1232 family)